MNPPRGKSWKSNRKRAKSRSSNGSVEFLPEELIAQVLSYLPAKSLMQLRCVSKAWNTLISHPKFIKQHLQQSKKITQILCMSHDFSILPFPLNTLLNNPSIMRSTKYHFPSNPNYYYRFIGSCNGLFCFLLIGLSSPTTSFQLWNPATNTLSNQFGNRFSKYGHMLANYSFVYDNSTDTYYTVYFRHHLLDLFSSSSGSNVPKKIGVFGISPLFLFDNIIYKHKFFSDAVYLNGTINLLGRARDFAKKTVIISLNLATCIYKLLLPPQDFVEDFVEDSYKSPTIHVLKDSLCFSHHTLKTHFIIWKMTEFGIENSWTQFLKISYRDLNIHMEYFLAPLCLCESGIALVLGAEDVRLQVIVYNLSENRVEKIRRIHKGTKWISNQNYVESLVPTSCVTSCESLVPASQCKFL